MFLFLKVTKCFGNGNYQQSEQHHSLCIQTEPTESHNAQVESLGSNIDYRIVPLRYFRGGSLLAACRLLKYPLLLLTDSFEGSGDMAVTRLASFRGRRSAFSQSHYG